MAPARAFLLRTLGSSSVLTDVSLSSGLTRSRSSGGCGGHWPARQPSGADEAPSGTAVRPQLRPFGLRYPQKKTLPHAEGKQEATEAPESPEAAVVEDMWPSESLQRGTVGTEGSTCQAAGTGKLSVGAVATP